ncbi:MAG: MBL fold metallo-hydrolase [Methanobacteriota archaeon]|nr:MAG: MBL fold metallo-hydrolase [Euryarchaeota archaeon]
MHDSSIAVLSSGSCGNSILVSSDETSLLVDAGISCKELERRLSLFGTDPSRIDAILLTHEHTDHNRGAQRFCRTHGVPLYGTEGTLALTPHDDAKRVTLSRRRAFEVGDVSVQPFPVMHLAADPVAYSLTIDEEKLSIASDLGCLTKGVVDEMTGATILMIEANYDDAMLRIGSYPSFLKKAILSDHGHLSNDGAGDLSIQAASDSLRDIVLLHLSKDNNRSDIARDTVSSRIDEAMPNVRVTPTEHGSHSGPFRLR